jgi:predicted MFS family arabinose efflux permease
LIAEIFIAFAASCISGCDKALLYDSLAQINKDKDYNKISGIFSSLANFAESFGAIIAGIVANYRLKLPFILDLSTIIIAGCIILSLKEVPIERFDHKEA